MQKLIVILFLLVLAISCKKDQDKAPEVPVKKLGKLSGYVKNKYGQPIENALVQSGTISTTTSASGSYLLENLPANNNAISVSKNGFYLAKVENIIIKEDVTNVLDFTLESGVSYLKVSENLLDLPDSAGFVIVKISSNSGWTVKSASSLFTFSKDNGNGNDEIYINYNNKNQARIIDTIKFSVGDIVENLVVKLYPKTKVVSSEGSIGNDDLGIRDSVYLHFNNAISAISVINKAPTCQTDIQYHINGTNVAFTYGCGKLGGSFPFSITVTDQFGKLVKEDIVVPFYKSKLDINGRITDYVLVNDDKEAIIASFSPSRVIRYSIEKNIVLHTYDFSNYISPIKLSYNPYDKKIYVMGSNPDAVYIYTNIDKPDIYTVDLQTDKVVKALTILPDAADAPNYPVNIPFNIAFTKLGHGMILLRSNASSAMRWKLIDGTKNNLISNYTHPITNADYFDNVKMNYDQTKLILTQRYTGSCDYGVFDGNTQKVSILRPSSVTRSIFITPNKKNNQIYFGQLYDQFIMDLSGNISNISYLDNRRNGSADFSYRPNENNIIYFCDDDYFRILNYNNSKTLLTTKVAYALRNFTSTIDGKLATAYQNGDGKSSFIVLKTESFYANIDK